MTDEATQTGMAEVETSDAMRRMPAEIIKARIEVMKQAHGVGKGGYNDFHKYAYASDYDVLSLVQPAMAENGLILQMWPYEVHGPDEDANMSVLFMMQWQHEDGAVADPIPWWGIAQDKKQGGGIGDKWYNKAATAAEKYFLLKQFHIPAGKEMDPDSDGGTQAESAPARTYKAGATRGTAEESSEKFKRRIDACDTLADINKILPLAKSRNKAPEKKRLSDRANGLGFVWSDEQKLYTDPQDVDGMLGLIRAAKTGEELYKLEKVRGERVPSADILKNAVKQQKNTLPDEEESEEQKGEEGSENG